MTIWQFLILLAEINLILAIVLLICWARRENRTADTEFKDNLEVWNNLQNQPYISKRFALKKYLGWTDRDIDDHLK